MSHRALRAGVVCYAALFVAPLPAPVVGVTPAAFLAGGLVGAITGWIVTDRYDAVDGLLSRPVAVLGSVAPLGWVVFGLRAGVPVRVPSYWLAGGLAVLLFLGLLLAAHAVRTQRRNDRLETFVTFEARQPARTRRQTGLAVGTFVVLAAVGVVAMFVVLDADVEPATLLPMLTPWWISLLNGQEREVAVTDEGLLVQQQLHEWETIDGYDVDDEALTITRTEWYHSDQSFDPEDVDDLDAVTDALDRYVTDRSVRG